MSREEQIDQIRNFNRFYLLRFQLLNEKLNCKEHSLAEVMVLSLLNERAHLRPSELSCQLQLDKGYLSRTLNKLEIGGLIHRRRSIQDGRFWLISLTERGRSLWTEMEVQYRTRLNNFISKLPDENVEQLLSAMNQIRELTATNLSRSANITEGCPALAHTNGTGAEVNN